MIIRKIHMITGKYNELDLPVTEEQISKWQNGGLIQKVMPQLTDEQREFMISGLLPGEFDQIFKNEEKMEKYRCMEHFISSEGRHFEINEVISEEDYLLLQEDEQDLFIPNDEDEFEDEDVAVDQEEEGEEK